MGLWSLCITAESRSFFLSFFQFFHKKKLPMILLGSLIGGFLRRGDIGGKWREMWGRVEEGGELGKQGREGHGKRKTQIVPHFFTDTLDFDQKIFFSFIKSRSERKGKKRNRNPPGGFLPVHPKTRMGKTDRKGKRGFSGGERKRGRRERMEWMGIKQLFPLAGA